MYNKKWKKLSKRFACALALAMLMSVNPAWAKVEEDKNDSTTLRIENETVEGKTIDGYTLSDYKEVYIDNTGMRGIRLWDVNFDLSDTDLYIDLTSNSINSDAIQLNGGHSTIKNIYVTNFDSSGSDIISLTHDGQDSSVSIGNITVENMSRGSGVVRANSTIKESGGENRVTITGDAYITTSGSSITAIWAGSDAGWIYIPGLYDVRNKSHGKGIAQLKGNTVLTMTGNYSKGLWAGRNGEISVNNITINSSGSYSYGIQATNGNITYGEKLDKSDNICDSKIIMNGTANEIMMTGHDSYALYADSQYGIIESGANGIGYLNAKGAITAEDEGTINLKLRDFLKVEGTLSALNGGEVSIVYGKGTDENKNQITGDLVADGGKMSITGTNAMKLDGGAFAANGGELTLSLGSGSVWAGRVDDYQDAANENWATKHKEIFETPITSINKDGDVTVSLASGAKWNVTGQSWVSKLDGSGIIDLRGSETGGYAIHLGELTGSNTFYLNLYNGDKIGDGDMIYIAKEVTAPQKIVIANRDEVLSSMNAGDRIRFATIGGGVGFSESSAPAASAAAFGRSTKISDAGMMNVNFSIDYLGYKDTANDGENDEAYHGEEMTENKPGADYVESIYGPKENSQNVYVTRLKSEELSDAGRTVLNMSRANYAAAVYMDRLNKRMGEARYFAGQDEGIWARIRHDRVGKEDAYLVQNTMFEVGFDRKLESKNGTRRVGIAADYMEGDTEYNNIAGKGEIDRFGLWLYSTWFGEKGHYTDYVLKWGRMSNEFDIYAMTTGERITGDYDNNVFSASAEYGRRIELGKGWFFEPQAQVQFARITEADYVTSQGTRVEADGINSLIARAGFRLGREFGGNTKGSVYIKADVLHEFLGDQDIHALDSTTEGRWQTVGYENDGTWYDVGLGLSCMTGKNSFVFLDLEHSFGNDNDDSYQISAGVQWSF